MSKPELTWFFTATHRDGSVVKQTREDISLTKENGSAFSDVDLDTVVEFSLRRGMLNGVSVNLVSGDFKVNGQVISLKDQFEVVGKLKLIYYRDTRIERDLNATGDEIDQRHFVYGYYIGWEARDVKGKTIKRTIMVT